MTRAAQTRNPGISLIDVVIAVATLAIFVGALSPMILHHRENLRLAKAEKETTQIAAAALARFRDTGVWQAAEAGLPDDNLSPPQATARADAAAAMPAWVLSGTAANLTASRNLNSPVVPSGAAGTPAADPRVDPWGQAYTVHVAVLPDTTAAGAVHHKIFVLSAGPNGRWETAHDAQANGALGGDDVGTVITIR